MEGFLKGNTMKYFIIGSGVGADYSAIDTFISATLSGVLLADPDAPYVGLLQKQTHILNDTATQYTVSGVPVNGTNQSHYYIFKPLETHWKGSEDISDCTTINSQQSIAGILPWYTKIYGCVITASSSGSASSLGVLNGYGTSVYNCLFDNVYLIYTGSAKSPNLVLGAGIEGTPNNFYNCVWNTITLNATSAAKPCIISLDGNHYNCAVKNVTITPKAGGSGIFVLSNASYNSIYANSGICVGSIQSSIVKNNAFVENKFTTSPDATNFTPYDATNHYQSSYYYPSINSQLYGSGVYPGFNYGSINGIEYWPYMRYDVGPLYFKKTVLYFRQNNKTLVLRTL
jgi:hypothetical protein